MIALLFYGTGYSHGDIWSNLAWLGVSVAYVIVRLLLGRRTYDRYTGGADPRINDEILSRTSNARDLSLRGLTMGREDAGSPHSLAFGGSRTAAAQAEARLADGLSRADLSYAEARQRALDYHRQQLAEALGHAQPQTDAPDGDLPCADLRAEDSAGGQENGEAQQRPGSPVGHSAPAQHGQSGQAGSPGTGTDLQELPPLWQQLDARLRELADIALLSPAAGAGVGPLRIGQPPAPEEAFAGAPLTEAEQRWHDALHSETGPAALQLAVQQLVQQAARDDARSVPPWLAQAVDTLHLVLLHAADACEDKTPPFTRARLRQEVLGFIMEQLPQVSARILGSGADAR